MLTLRSSADLPAGLSLPSSLARVLERAGRESENLRANLVEFYRVSEKVMVMRTANYEQLAMRFVELLNDRATRSGQMVSRWTVMASTWRRIFIETVHAFLDELAYRVISDGRIDERDEDEQIRLLCDNLTARQRLKTYRQLYALGCRIDQVQRGIERLTPSRG
jgi:hypothetical protein